MQTQARAEHPMRDLIEFAIRRGCHWASPWKPGENLKVMLPDGVVFEYANGDQTDIDALDAKLKARRL